MFPKTALGRGTVLLGTVVLFLGIAAAVLGNLLVSTGIWLISALPLAWGATVVERRERLTLGEESRAVLRSLGYASIAAGALGIAAFVLLAAVSKFSAHGGLPIASVCIMLIGWGLMKGSKGAY